MTTEQLSGRMSNDELNRALAPYAGYEFHAEDRGTVVRACPDGYPFEHWHEIATRMVVDLPDFTSSVDALIAGPEAKLIAAGWAVEVTNHRSGGFMAGWARTFDATEEDATATGATEAEARARAVLQVLTAIAAIEEARGG